MEYHIISAGLFSNVTELEKVKLKKARTIEADRIL